MYGVDQGVLMDVSSESSNKKVIAMETLRSFNHEVRNDLSTILGIAWYLKKYPNPDDYTELLAHINQAGRNITKCLKNFTENSKANNLLPTIQSFPAVQPSIQFKALIVDDSAKVRKRLTMLLNQVGCKVDVAKNGYEALNKALTIYDLILIDISLKDMDVIELVRDLRKVQANNSCKIVALTAFGQEIQYELLRAGVNDIVSKFSSPQRILGLLTKETTPKIGL
jgi:CheY-like chemotaxis protein